MNKQMDRPISIYDGGFNDSVTGKPLKVAGTIVETEGFGKLHVLVRQNEYSNGGIKVAVFRDKNGKPNTNRVLNECSFDGYVGDLSEAAEMYANRLAGGSNPEVLFRDTEEALTKYSEAVSQKLKK